MFEGFLLAIEKQCPTLPFNVQIIEMTRSLHAALHTLDPSPGNKKEHHHGLVLI